jgi:hypothetical protein
MALLALILASSLSPAPDAPRVQAFTLDRAPFIATACDVQMDAKFVHPLPLTPSLRSTVHLTQGEASACLQRGPDVGKRISQHPGAARPSDDPVQLIQQDPQAPAP